MGKSLNIFDRILYNLLKNIFVKVRNHIYKKYKRVNPFYEDFTDWKERGKFLFGKTNVTVYGSSNVAGDVNVGNNTWIGPYTALDGSGGLNIGENCSISSKVNIVSHDTVKWALSGGIEAYEYASISIGNNCFIGTGAFIGKGVTLGNHCLVAAGAVVTKSFPDFSIIAGIPAKKIGKVLLNDEGKITLSYGEEKE